MLNYWIPRYLLCRLKGSYSKTINTPKFPFSIHPIPLSQSKTRSDWLSFYKLQSTDVKRPLYVLHDGPPYANGNLHVGHALNKFLKDIVIRYKLLSGYRVDYIPGWDCHGLPIELKAIESSQLRSALEIRKSAHKVAGDYIDLQRCEFENWGIFADWSNYYYTMSPSFQKAEISAFARLHQKGLVYRDLLPVHWSTKAKTALAESELEYNAEHSSSSIYLRLRLSNPSPLIVAKLPPFANVYTVVWTTTPWTLPGNEAVVYDPTATYSLLKPERTDGDFYLVSDQFVSNLEAILSNGKLKKIETFLGLDLEGCSYFQPFWAMTKNELICKPFLPGSHVVDTKGTGLVHCAPCHGKEDFAVGRNFNLPMHQFVDDNGCFTEAVGSKFSGLIAHSDGNLSVMNVLEPEILLKESIKHSYPYDWRTHTPVITRLSDQWFVDTAKLAPLALLPKLIVRLNRGLTERQLQARMVEHVPKWVERLPQETETNIITFSEHLLKSPMKLSLKCHSIFTNRLLMRCHQEAYEHVNVIPAAHKSALIPFISSRPNWCISRQRSWGLPIPVLLSIDDRSPLVDYEFIHHIGERISQNGADFWFQESVADLVPDRFWKKWKLHPDQLLKSTDVFDVWYDSGLSWLSVLENGVLSFHDGGHRVADVYLEGQDQFRGWFSSSLLMSVALRGCAPFKSIIVHGMATDSDGRKMSKSLGNVVSPDQLLDRHNGCVDILRRWGACSALESVTTVGFKEIDRHADSYKMLRNSLRFMLGNLFDFRPSYALSKQYNHNVSNHYKDVNSLILDFVDCTTHSPQLTALDRSVLGSLGCLIQSALSNHYPSCRYATILADVDRFLSNLSAVYMTSVKDVLYCDPMTSSRRQKVQSVFFLLVEGIKAILAPLSPFLLEEVETASKYHWKNDNVLKHFVTEETLLERLSRSTSEWDGSENSCPTSHWFTCLSAMSQWGPMYKESCQNVDLLRSFYLSVINQFNSHSTQKTTSVNPLVNFHVQLNILPSSVSEQLIDALCKFEASGSKPTNNSELCQFFRSASINWLAVEAEDHASRQSHLPPPSVSNRVFYNDEFCTYVEMNVADPATKCPRCMRFTRHPNAVLCCRCEQGLANDDEIKFEHSL